MTTFELDLSKSDSLIDDIQKIFKPPSVEASGNSRFNKAYLKSLQYNQNNENNLKDCNTFSQGNTFDENDNKSLKSGNVSWKKPKSNSHEYCDSCGTFEGERLVCDRCPASFHLECLDPPIDNDEAPVGVWYCNRCTAIMKEEDDKCSSASTGSNNKNENDSSNNGITNGCHGLLNTSAKRSVHSSSSASSEITTEMLSDEIPSKKRKSDNFFSNMKLTALQNIQDVVQCLNPKEFDLSKDLIPGIKLPNTYKTFAEMKTKSIVNMENGMIPRPVVVCFECSRTCLYGTLIQCDYCPLYFHLDCLDPPLVQLPSRVERWMCPNHIEQVIDNSGIIKTIRLSERMKAYEDLQREIGNIDEIDLLTSFASGCGFRFGSRLENDTKTRQKVKVPDAVIKMYKFPLKRKATNGTIAIEEDMLTEEQKTILTSLLRTSCKDMDIFGKDVTQLLRNALDSLRDLIATKNIDLFSELSSNCSVISKSGAEQIKSRALLIPLSKDGLLREQTSISRMIYRNCDIGSSLDNDCVVTSCKYVSPRHASICYLDNHFSFELVNYSRYGTVVDDLLYYNDVSDKESHRNYQFNQNIKDLRNFLGTNEKSARFNRKIVLNSMKSQRDVDKKITSCTCSEYGYTNNGVNNCMDQGWESTATLKFGSVIQLGCQKFLFTEVNHTLQPDLNNSVSPHPSSSISSDSHDSSSNKINPENTSTLSTKSPPPPSSSDTLTKTSSNITNEALDDIVENKKSSQGSFQSNITLPSNSHLKFNKETKIQSEESS